MVIVLDLTFFNSIKKTQREQFVVLQNFSIFLIVPLLEEVYEFLF